MANEMQETKVHVDEYGKLRGLPSEDFIYERDIPALRDYFQQERDEQLERWRWPECDFFVVYGWKHGVRVVNESVGTAATWQATTADGLPPVLGSPSHLAAAHAYFAARPKTNPKPWQEAKLGEVWTLGIDGGFHSEGTAVVEVEGELRFLWVRTRSSFETRPLDYKGIDYGRRVYPPVEES